MYRALLPWIFALSVASTFATEARTQLPEARAQALKARADYPAARAEYCRLMTASCADGAPDAARAALAEYCALMATLLLTEGLDDATFAAVDAARRSPLAQHDPALRGRLSTLLLQARRLHGGDLAQLADLARDLGVIRGCWICGPFDNERGQGFARAFPAESGFDPAASYDGKLRPVAWRRLPGSPPCGELDLAAALRPSTQVLAYVATAVIADAPTLAVLHLGSSGAVRVLLDGRQCFERDVERSVHDDQDLALLPLQKGPNLLVVKACQQEGEYRLRLRLSAMDGGPLAGVRCSDAREDLVAAAATAPRELPPDAGTPADNARPFYLAAARAGDAAAALRAACLLAHEHVDGDREPRARRLAEQAAQGLPDSAEAAFLVYWTRPRIVTSEADRDENPQRRDLAEVLRRDPDHVEARLLLAYHDLEGSRLPRQALQRLEEALAIQPQSSLAHSRRAAALRQLGLEALADRELDGVAALPAIAESALRELLQSRMQRREFAAAAATADATLRQSALPAARDLVARLWLQLGRRDDAVALLAATVQRWPFAREPRAMLANLRAAEDDAEGALREYTRWLEICPEDDQALVAMSKLWAARGDREREIETLRAALDLNPNLRDEQRYFEYLSSDGQAFHTAFEVDGEAVIQKDGGPPADSEAHQDPLYWLLRQSVVKAFANGTTSTYTHEIVHILREEGARSWANHYLRSYGGEQRGRILSCSVRRQDGSVEHPKLRGAGVAIPSLQPGDVVEVRGRVDDLAPSFFGEYFGLEHRFAAPDGAPVKRSLLTVLATPGRSYHWQGTHGAPEPRRETLADGTERYDWELDDLPRDDPEVRRPLPREREPVVRMSTYADWDHFAAWWWNLVEKQIDVTEPMRQKVKELCAGAATASQRIAAIYRFVTTDVRYEAWEFGVHGYKPYNTSIIFERRHGDCKDKALLLCALLREVGIVARPVLIWADEYRSLDDLTLPLVSHFNHCIAWLPAQDDLPEQFLDGTAQFHPVDTLPDMDQGAEVLVVDEAHARLARVPVVTPEQNVDDREFTIDLARGGSAAIAMTQAPRGNAAVALRYDLADSPATLREKLEQRLIARFGKVAMREVIPSDALDLAAPAVLRAKFDAAEAAQPRGQGLVLRTGFDCGALQQLGAANERHYPLLLGVPERFHEVLRIGLPPGMRVATLPRGGEQATPFGVFSLRWRRDGDHIVAERTLDLLAPRLAPAQYDAFRSFLAAVQDADSEVLAIEPEEVRR